MTVPCGNTCMGSSAKMPCRMFPWGTLDETRSIAAWLLTIIKALTRCILLVKEHTCVLVSSYTGNILLNYKAWTEANSYINVLAASSGFSAIYAIHPERTCSKPQVIPSAVPCIYQIVSADTINFSQYNTTAIINAQHSKFVPGNYFV